MRLPPLHRLTARLLLVVWMFGVALPLVERRHVEDIDIACGDIGWGASGLPESLKPAGSADSDDHCAVCHLQRAFRSAFTSSSSLVPSIERVVATQVAVGADASIGAASSLSSRAPPLV